LCVDVPGDRVAHHLAAARIQNGRGQEPIHHCGRPNAAARHGAQAGTTARILQSRRRTSAETRGIRSNALHTCNDHQWTRGVRVAKQRKVVIDATNPIGGPPQKGH
jgi:hypothetical protein